MATSVDVDLIYKWANDPTTRSNSYDSKPIPYDSHIIWFKNKLEERRCFFYIFEDADQTPIGQVRIEITKESTEAIISISIDTSFRNKGYSSSMLQIASANFLSNNPGFIILAFIFSRNTISMRSFLKAGFKVHRDQVVNNISSQILIYK